MATSALLALAAAGGARPEATVARQTGRTAAHARWRRRQPRALSVLTTPVPPSSCPLAEGVGFEPTVPIAGHNGFRDRPVRPLRHPSVDDLTGWGRRFFPRDS